MGVIASCTLIFNGLDLFYKLHIFVYFISSRWIQYWSVELQLLQSQWFLFDVFVIYLLIIYLLVYNEVLHHWTKQTVYRSVFNFIYFTIFVKYISKMYEHFIKYK